jgi:hypothetical protein
MLREAHEERFFRGVIHTIKSHPNWKERVRDGDTRLLKDVQQEMVDPLPYARGSEKLYVRKRKKQIAGFFRHIQKNLENGKPPFML